MSKVICYPNCCMPTNFEDGIWYFELFSKPKESRENVGYVGNNFMKELKRSRIRPSDIALDFVILALSVVSADKAVLRKKSPDGWTREIELTVYLHETEKWNLVKEEFEWMLRFLTGDFWKLNIMQLPKSIVPMYEHQERSCDCACLLSGGVDSLVGAIDLAENGRKPLFVSQVVKGDAEKQRQFANYFGQDNLCHWSCYISKRGESENSTRARSIVFFAYALLATCGIAVGPNGRKEIIVPENGFISLNIPLDAGRIGSLSTKTTHPVYMASLQKIWDKVGFAVNLVLPYKYKTKGEVVRDCKNKKILMETVFVSTSCGKFHRHGYRHCGVCVPCLVRRAAFMKAGLTDETVKGYCVENLKQAQSKDVAATTIAVMQEEQYGIDSVVKGGLLFANDQERIELRGVVSRGIAELREFLREQEVL